jgi:hypothetical protein
MFHEKEIPNRCGSETQENIYMTKGEKEEEKKVQYMINK